MYGLSPIKGVGFGVYIVDTKGAIGTRMFLLDPVN